MQSFHSHLPVLLLPPQQRVLGCLRPPRRLRRLLRRPLRLCSRGVQQQVQGGIVTPPRCPVPVCAR